MNPSSKKPSKKSLLPHWDGEVYTKFASPFYNVVTRLSGWKSKLNKYALEGLQPGQMLDVGCGTGYLMNLAQQNGFQVTGVDPSAGMLQKAKDVYDFSNKQLIQSGANQIPLSDKSFDLIISSGALVHIPSLDGIPNELLRLIKDNGILRIIDHAIPTKRVLSTPLATLFSQLSGDVLHDYPRIFGEQFELTNQKTIGRGGYMQIFDFVPKTSR